MSARIVPPIISTLVDSVAVGVLFAQGVLVPNWKTPLLTEIPRQVLFAVVMNVPGPVLKP